MHSICITRPQWVNVRNVATFLGTLMTILHDDVIKWEHFLRYWPFVQGIHRSPVNSPHKGQWRGALMFFFYLCLNKRLSKESWGWWFETPSHQLWCHCNVMTSSGIQRKYFLLFSQHWACKWPGIVRHQGSFRHSLFTWVWSPNICYRLTHWGRDKMEDIFQTTFSNAFSWMKMHELRFHWNLFLECSN